MDETRVPQAIDWSTVFKATSSLESLKIVDDFGTSDNTSFSEVCDIVIQSLSSHKRLNSITLRGVRISLPPLADLLTGPCVALRKRIVIMVNVRARKREDWRSFLARLKSSESLDHFDCGLQEWPHPNIEGSSTEWESIRDLVDDGPQYGTVADISRCLWPN